VIIDQRDNPPGFREGLPRLPSNKKTEGVHLGVFLQGVGQTARGQV